MADINNFTEITENFDTIKTLLNSIRAQGILNTSDVDKLLSGINSKLEKLNTEEDIDLIKIFLTELKQNLDERHSVLLSKFGAIESLFSNLLKNSSEALKSSEVKELFDIVATNLSVFSREVVSQKETLSDISLRLDAIRSDDSQKREIVKNISFLKNDLERLNNGFDSIVLNLNENFKTVIKSITSVDPTEVVSKFGKELEDIVNSSNTVLSAIQMLDKKSSQIEESIKGLATHDDLVSTKKWISDLVSQEQQLSQSVENLAEKYYKIDNLAEKIDASVDIIAGMKTMLSDKDEQSAKAIIDRLNSLEDFVRNVTSNKEFDEFKLSLEQTLNNIYDSSSTLQVTLNTSNEELKKINDSIKALDINVNFKTLAAGLSKTEQSVKEHVSVESDKLIQLVDVNATRTLNELSSNTDILSEKLIETQNLISGICEKSFSELEESIAGLKGVVSQIDENNVSANNAIFSNITDRLALFENSLKSSLETQEKYIANSSTDLKEQIGNIKDLSGVLDYKLDSSVIEINNAKTEFAGLRKAVEDVLSLDFVTKVSDLKVDLYAAKQELTNLFETTTSDFSDKYSNDLFSKYELLISKLDSVEEELKSVQSQSLTSLKGVLDNMSASLVDILSYVSSTKEVSTEALESKLSELCISVNDNKLSYIESIKDVVDSLREHLDNTINVLHEDTFKQIESMNSAIDMTRDAIREDIRNSYDKLVEVQKCFGDIQDSLNANNSVFAENINNVLGTASKLKEDFDNKLSILKNAIIEKVADFQKDFTCENADKISELKFSYENLYSKQMQNSQVTKDELKGEISQIAGTLRLNIEELAEQLSGTGVKIEGLGRELTNIVQNDVCAQISDATKTLSSNLSVSTNNVSEKLEGAISKFEDINNNINECLVATSQDIHDNLENYVSRVGEVGADINDNIERAYAGMSEKYDNTLLKVSSIEDSVSNSIRSVSDEVREKLNDSVSKFDDISKNIDEKIETLSESIGERFEDTASKFNLVNGNVNNNFQIISDDIKDKFETAIAKLNEVDLSVNNLSGTTTTAIASTLAKILDNFVSLKTLVGNLSEKTSDDIQNSVETLIKEFSALKDKVEDVDTSIDEDLTRQLSIIESNFESISSNLGEFFLQSNQLIGSTINNGLENVSNSLNKSVIDSLEQYKDKINLTIDDIFAKSNHQIELMETKTLELNDLLQNTMKEQNAISAQKMEEITTNLSNILKENIDLSTADYNALKASVNEFLRSVENQNKETIEQLRESVALIENGLKKNSGEISDNLKNINDELIVNLEERHNDISSKVSNILTNIKDFGEDIENKTQDLKQSVSEGLIESVKDLYEKISSLLEQNTLNLITQSDNNNSRQIENFDKKVSEIKSLFSVLDERLDKDEISRMNVFQSQLSELSNSFSALIEETKSSAKRELASMSEVLMQTNKDSMADLEQQIEEKFNTVLSATADIAAGDLQSMESFANKILDQVKVAQSSIDASKNFLADFVKNELEMVADNIEKESDIIVKDLLEQMSLMKDFHRDEITKLAAQLEGSIEDIIYNNINELKSYIDIKSDTTVLNGKLDSINTAIGKTAEDILTVSNNLLKASVFENSISDMKAANKVLISSMADSLNSQIKTFVKTNLVKDIDEKFNIFDKKFVDTVVDKYEEIKLISSKYNNAFELIQASIKDLLSNFGNAKEEICQTLLSMLDGVKNEVDELNLGFADLKEQILNKSFDEAFQASINNQITDIQSLIKEQFSYVEDISSLCCNNLPELTEMNALVKYNLIESIKDINNRLDTQDANVEKELAELKTDVITQFLNIFNQISFVAEQEEILDFIQEKHSELITILSHIVTRNDDVDTIRDNMSQIDTKVDTIKEDINSINDKINSLISSSGDIDYVYSLQDLESDIANLRLTLNDIKESSNTKELEDLIKSTNGIYELVESLKSEFPKFDAEEFKKDFEALNEDIVSISTRTNKLILASDESYKTLQDNLQDFKLVINDLDERTRNFAHEAGIDRIDNKLGVINSMIQSGAKTNQVFNQVFEYLAEWVDNAGSQISSISDKVETLDDIGQIKVMLEDLKAEAEDNSDSAELIEALSNVFEKQAKKISSLEAKLDRVIVETTISNKNNKLDLTPIEETLNRFLVAVDDKMLSQQSKIDSLESKLTDVMSMINPKDTAQLTKKVGGMDRQIAKLNKSIEKIASHVVEK